MVAPEWPLPHRLQQQQRRRICGISIEWFNRKTGLRLCFVSALLVFSSSVLLSKEKVEYDLQYRSSLQQQEQRRKPGAQHQEPYEHHLQEITEGRERQQLLQELVHYKRLLSNEDHSISRNNAFSLPQDEINFFLGQNVTLPGVRAEIQEFIMQLEQQLAMQRVQEFRDERTREEEEKQRQEQGLEQSTNHEQLQRDVDVEAVALGEQVAEQGQNTQQIDIQEPQQSNVMDLAHLPQMNPQQQQQQQQPKLEGFSLDDYGQQQQQNQQSRQEQFIPPQWSLEHPSPRLIALQNIPPSPLPSYNIDNIRLTLPSFYRELFLLYYHPGNDEFQIFIDEKRDKWNNPNRNRINVVMGMLAASLRTNFPERFGGIDENYNNNEEGGGSNGHNDDIKSGNEEDDKPINEPKRHKDFYLLVSTGDEPKLHCQCVDPETRREAPNFCQNDKFAPILQFGSVFRDRSILPGLITMPVWSHVSCFREWVKHRNHYDSSVGEERRRRWIPECFKGMDRVAGVMGGEDALKRKRRSDHDWDDSREGGNGEDEEEELQIVSTTSPNSEETWNKLIPQIVWRGTDFEFLHCMYRVRHADFDMDIEPRLRRGSHGYDTRGVASSLLDAWKRLTPRWRAFALTAVAELDWKDSSSLVEDDHKNDAQDPTENQRSLPWIDSKFTIREAFFGQAAQFDQMNIRYLPFEEYDVHPVGERMSKSDLSYYKYHVDFGGGGGTTYEGTKDKLAMPGVLFHHITPTKDYFHADITPWIHYIPIDTELSDLREKFEWAESHPIEARLISERATSFAQFMASQEFLDGMYERYFANSLRRVVDAYVPSEGSDAEIEGKKQEMLRGWTLIGKCDGRNWFMHSDCSYVKDPN